jgi:CheY-like chemotaxis protein
MSFLDFFKKKDKPNNSEEKAVDNVIKENKSQPATQQNETQEKKPWWEGATILVAEDDEGLREVLADKLEEEGFTVLQAINGEQCIDLAFKEYPDLILLDLYMPKSTGFDVLDKLVGDPWGRKAKVIVLTNRGDFSSKRKVFQLMHISYLIKAENSLEEITHAIKEKLTEAPTE